MNICSAVTSFLNNSSNKRVHDEKINSGNFCCSCILTYKLDLITTNGNDSNLLIVFYVQIMPDDFVMQLHRF